MQKALWYQVIKMMKSTEIHSKDLFYFIGDPLDLLEDFSLNRYYRVWRRVCP